MKSPFVLKALATSIDDNFLKNILKNMIPMTLEDLILQLSPILDREILNICQKENLYPIGGQIKLQEMGHDITIDWEFYFKDQNDNLVEKSSQRIINPKTLDKKSLSYIKKNSPIYTINPPTGENNEYI